MRVRSLLRLLRIPAARAVAVVVLALALTAVLNAQSLRKTAHGQAPGVARTAALAVTEPLVWLSHRLYLDRPRHEVQRLVGREGVDRVDVAARVAAPSAGRRAVGSGAVPGTQPRDTRAGRESVAPPVKERTQTSPPVERAPAAEERARFDAARPLRVWVAGDSLVVVPGQSLERAASKAPAVEVVGVEGRLATGLTRPDVYNWFTRFSEVIAGLRPDAVVLSFGSNDAHHFMSGVPAGRSLGEFGSATWNGEYRRRVESVTRAFTEAGTYVVWMGLPRARSENRNPRFRVLNRIVRQVAGRHEGAAFVDAWALLLDRRGRYAEYLPGIDGTRVRVRAADGVHYEPAGGDLVAAAVLERLGREFDLVGSTVSGGR